MHLFLQDPDCAGAFLDGEAVRADHPARRAAARLGGSADGCPGPPASRPDNALGDWDRIHRDAGYAVQAHCRADCRSRRVRRSDRPAGASRAQSGAASLDIGINDDLNVVRFHAKEQTEGRTFRWSQRQSFIIVNGIRTVDRTVALWMNNGGRPAAAPPADVDVLIGSRSLG